MKICGKVKDAGENGGRMASHIFPTAICGKLSAIRHRTQAKAIPSR